MNRYSTYLGEVALVFTPSCFTAKRAANQIGIRFLTESLPDLYLLVKRTAENMFVRNRVKFLFEFRVITLSHRIQLQLKTHSQSTYSQSTDAIEDVTKGRVNVDPKEHDQSKIDEIREQEVHKIVGSHSSDSNNSA